FLAMAIDFGSLQFTMDPFENFALWFREAQEAKLHEPTAMTLATADGDGRPHARIVLYKGLSKAKNGATGFRLFTNYDSPKAKDLEENPFAALVFHWGLMGRQVRVEGP